ncbi:hypothetical protein FUA23_10270 [Neolewinella aurantiaca]|uniref:DUF5723 domain-containing protein n=1 Tax=Neolewinella aurantiaca TaxID=2602767 RepID=A0A5C7FXA5_9BACT|nr:DUF5723 family protein [Neolewinella aurantiaca]TXF89576.1 hypothetical protein FUA23_10270 [Neolewinella aurantiaca]
MSITLPCSFNIHRTCVLALMLFCGTLSAQDLTVPLFSDSWQATFSNPALYGQAKGRLTVGLPGVSNDLYAENVTYNELLETEDGTRVLDLNQLPGLLGQRNELRDDFSLETLGVGLRGDRFSLGLYHRLRAGGQADYPKTLAQLVVQGNAQFIGQTVEIAPLIAGSSYHEVGLGGSMAVTENIHFGARIKYLSGIADARTGTSGSLLLTTGEENYALTLEQDLTLNTAGTVDYNGLDDVGINYDFNRIKTDNIFSENNGVAFDLGLFASFGKVRLQAAANDLGGKINWTNDVTSFRLAGTDEFSGLDILAQVLEDSLSFVDALDSLQLTFEPTEDNSPYDSKLSATYLVGGEYDFTDRLTGGLLLVHYRRPLNSETAFALSARYRIVDELTVGLNYNARKDATANFGAHVYAHLGPVNLIASTDNLLTVFRQKDSSRAGLRLGASLSIGVEKEEKVPETVN